MTNSISTTKVNSCSLRASELALGFEKIENLEEFTDLKVIYLEGNGKNSNGLVMSQDRFRKDRRIGSLQDVALLV